MFLLVKSSAYDAGRLDSASHLTSLPVKPPAYDAGQLDSASLHLARGHSPDKSSQTHGFGHASMPKPFLFLSHALLIAYAHIILQIFYLCNVFQVQGGF